jgi:hypothetical protein
MLARRSLGQLDLKQKVIIGGVAVPTFLLLGFGGFVLWRIFKASKTESGEGEASDKPEVPPPSGSCRNIESQLATPAGCGVVNVMAYNKGKPERVTISEIPGNPGFYLQSYPVNALAAFNRMRAAARAVGIEIRINSSFRTQGKQEELYRKYLTGRGNLAAKPGMSNHQYGTTLDLDVRSTMGKRLYEWLKKKGNGERYGFIDDVRGKQYEPWHWHYRPELDKMKNVRGVV